MDRKQLEMHYEIARGDLRRLSYLLAEVRRKEPDNLVAIAMMSPVVEVAKRAVQQTEGALRAAGADRRNRMP
jgi:hypothetical protein